MTARVFINMSSKDNVCRVAFEMTNNVSLSVLMIAGDYEARFDATTLPSVLYFYMLQTPTITKQRKMQVVK